MNLKIEIVQMHNGKVSVLITPKNISIGFRAEADDVKTALIQCYAKVLNWMWMMKTK